MFLFSFFLSLFLPFLFFLSLFSFFFPFSPFFPLFFFPLFYFFFQGGPRAPLEAPRITGPSKKVRVDTPISSPDFILFIVNMFFSK